MKIIIILSYGLVNSVINRPTRARGDQAHHILSLPGTLRGSNQQT